MRRPLVIILPLVLTLALAGCGLRGKTFDDASRARLEISARVAASTAVSPARLTRSVAALSRAQRRAFHRLIVHLWFARWLAHLTPPLEEWCGPEDGLPPCYIMRRESNGNPHAVNPGHRGAPYGDPGDPARHASGLYQDMPTTWAGYGGYPYAAAAPVVVQLAFNRRLYAAQGLAPWACC